MGTMCVRWGGGLLDFVSLQVCVQGKAKAAQRAGEERMEMRTGKERER